MCRSHRWSPESKVWTALRHCGQALVVFSLVGIQPAGYAGEDKSLGAGVYARGKPSVVMLEVVGELFNGTKEVSRGTGFSVANGGKILSNSHVVPEPSLYKTVEMHAYAGTREAIPEKFSILFRDKENDLVVVQLENKREIPKLPLGDSDETKAGDHVHVLGFPLTYDLSITDGIISNKSAPKGQWQTSVPLNPGNSGGPVFDQKGRAVALVVGGVPKAKIDGYGEINVAGISFLIPINTAKRGILKSLASELKSVVSPAVQGSSVLRKAYEISVTKDDHPVLFAPHSRDYKEKFRAEPGYRIIDAKFYKLSANKEGSETVNILPGGLEVEIAFRLTSGPLFDQWRGWYTGTLQTVQEPIK